MGRMDQSMQMIAIMQEFHWTYNEYMDTPNYVLTLIIEKMKRDSKAEEMRAKSLHRGY